MGTIKRLYEKIITDHLDTCRQMAFLAGPRQVGKTTLSKMFLESFSKSLYLNWDRKDHRQIIQSSSLNTIISKLDLDGQDPAKRLLVLDEIHKYPNWKNWVKGIFDSYEDKLSIIVTGSAMLNVYRAGQDSMMGRYFLYRIHPLSVGELTGGPNTKKEISSARPIEQMEFENLLKFGGFPEPFLAAQMSKQHRWSLAREQLLFKEDMRDLSNVQEVSNMQLLAKLLGEQIGKNTSYSNLARKIQVDSKTIKRWINILEYLYYCFTIRPWSNNITRSLIKEPKYYLWDWSQVKNDGARKENFIASHLLKAIHYWSDIGLSKHEYGLYYLRDKDKREVDFLVTKEDKPWFLVEVKSSNHRSISPSLRYFQQATGAPHAFQVAFDEPYADVDCFSIKKPVIVSAQNFLSQLV